MTNYIAVKEIDFIRFDQKQDEILEKLADIENRPSLPKLWLTPKEVCQILSISARTLQSYRDNGILPFSQIGSKIYFKKIDLDAVLEFHYQESAKNQMRILGPTKTKKSNG